MEIIFNSVQTPKPADRLFTLIKDRVFIALVLAFSVLTALDQTQAYQSLQFSLQSMLQIAPFFILAIAFAGYAKATGIDAGSGGSLEGVIAGVDEVLVRIDDSTKVIPGHGPLGNKTDLKAYRDMLTTVQGRMTKLVKEGKTMDEIVAAKPTADYDAKWGGGFLKPDPWVKIVYSVMQK